MFKGLASFIQMFLDAIVMVLNAVCLLFTPSPFQIIENNGFYDLIAKINYFIPIFEFDAIVELWVVHFGLFYTFSVVALGDTAFISCIV